MGQKVNSMVFRSSLFGFWKVKSYPTNTNLDLIKKFNIYKIIQAFLWQKNTEIVVFKSYVYLGFINIFVFFYNYSVFFKQPRKKIHYNLKKTWKNYSSLVLSKKYQAQGYYKQFFFFKFLNNTLLNYLRFTKVGLNFNNIGINLILVNSFLKNLLDLLGSIKLFLIFKIKSLGNQTIFYLLSQNYLINFIKFITNILFLYLNYFFYGTFYALKKKNQKSGLVFYKNILQFYKNKEVNKKQKLVALKLEKLELEKILFKSTGKQVSIHLKNIYNVLSVKNLIKVPLSSRMWWTSYLFFFNDFIHILYFATHLYNSKILATFISRNITSKKRHFTTLNHFKRIMKYFFWFEKPAGFLGIYIRVHGKFQGVLRKRKYKFRLGKTGFHTIETRIDYNLQQSFTRFGVFSIKVWLLYKF